MDQAKNDVRMALETAIRETEERLLPQRGNEDELEQRLLLRMALDHMHAARRLLEDV